MEINAHFFGNFNIVYEGTPLFGEKVHKESQFNRLLLAVLYAWPHGVDKDELERFVIGENELNQEHTALRIIVYKAKKKLVKLGLPDINLIYHEKGVFYWCKEIPVVTDCRQMEEYYEKAEAIKEAENKDDIEKSMSLYMDAAYLYKGEFLEMYGAEIQVAQLAKKYRKLFVACINNAAKMMQKLKDWDNLEELGRFAVSAQPLCNWEELVMEALVQKRMFEDATAYFDINHEGEIVDAVHRAFLNNMFIVGFEGCIHNRNYISSNHIYAAEQVNDMIAAVRQAMESKEMREKFLAEQKAAALAIAGEEFSDKIGLSF